MDRPFPIPASARRSRLVGTLLAVGLGLSSCSEPAPAALDAWPGYDPAERPDLLLDFASLVLHVRADRRDQPGEVWIRLPDGSEVTRDLPSLIANDDMFPLGLMEPGEIELELRLGEGEQLRVARRRATLLPSRPHGLAFDLRTEGLAPASLELEVTHDGTLDADAVVERIQLLCLDHVLEARRTGAPLDEDQALEVTRAEDGRLWLQATGLAVGEHVLRVSPGGRERLLVLESGANSATLEVPSSLARLEIELAVEGLPSPPDTVVGVFTAPVDGDREPTVVAPETAVYADGRLVLEAAPGPVHLLLQVAGLGTRFQSFDLPAEGQRGRLELPRRDPRLDRAPSGG